MSSRRREDGVRDLRGKSVVFFALGDETRLMLLAELSRGSSCSIVHLTQGSALTRQAITKHLRVLQQAGVVRGVRNGREKLYQLDPRPLEEARQTLERISTRWDAALARLRALVEE